MNNRYDELEKKIARIEMHLENVKQELQYERQKELNSIKASEKGQLKQKEEEFEKSHTPPSKSSDSKKQQKPSIKWEQELQQKWLPRVFLFVLVIGFLWGFIAAVEEGWITQPMRIGIGFLTSIGLFAAGEAQAKRNRKTLGIPLIAGSIMLLVLTTFAMNSLYGYIGFWPAFILFAAWIALGLWSSQKHQSEVLAIMVAIGGYLIPFLIDGADKQNPSLFYVYETVLYLTYLFYARKNQYTLLYYVSYFLLHIVTIVYAGLSGFMSEGIMLILSAVNLVHIAYAVRIKDQFLYVVSLVMPHLVLLVYTVSAVEIREWEIISIVLIQHLLLAYLYFTKRDKDPAGVYGALFGSLFFLFGWMNSLLWNDQQIEWTIAGLAVLYIGALCLYWNKCEEKRGYAAAMATVTIGLYLFMTTGENLQFSLYILEGAVGMYIGRLIQRKVQWSIGAVLYLYGSLELLDQPLEAWWSVETASYILILASLGYWVKTRKDSFYSFLSNYTKAIVVLFSAAVLFVLTIYTKFAAEGLGNDLTAISVSGAWLLYAIGFIIIGKIRSLARFITFGSIMMFVVLLKVTFIDISISSVVIRAALFVCLGGIGLIVSRLVHQSEKQD